MSHPDGALADAVDELFQALSPDLVVQVFNALEKGSTPSEIGRLLTDSGSDLPLERLQAFTRALGEKRTAWHPHHRTIQALKARHLARGEWEEVLAVAAPEPAPDPESAPPAPPPDPRSPFPLDTPGVAAMGELLALDTAMDALQRDKG